MNYKNEINRMTISQNIIHLFIPHYTRIVDYFRLFELLGTFWFHNCQQTALICNELY